MSGGHFDYKQYSIENIIESINDLIINNVLDSDERNEYGDRSHTNYSYGTIQEFKKAVKYLKLAQVYMHRIDFLVSGDDGEEDFHKLLGEDLEDLNE